jgi:hypothetical protein
MSSEFCRVNNQLQSLLDFTQHGQRLERKHAPCLVLQGR